MRLLWCVVGAALYLSVVAQASHAAAEDDPEPGIWLEMALLACERGEQKNAERLFRYIEEKFSPPPGIRALIDHARTSACPPGKAAQGYVAAGFGWSSNVNRGAVQTSFLLPNVSAFELRLAPEFHPRADSFAFAEGERRFAAGAGVLQLFAALRHHSSMRDFDEDSFGLSWQVAGPNAANPSWRSSVTVAQSFLGGNRYAEHFALSGALRGAFLTVSAQWQTIRYPQARAFDARQTTVRLGNELRLNDWRATIRAGLRLEDASASRPGGDHRGLIAEIKASHPGPFG